MRRPYIDWLRGVAVLCMIEWHVIDAWTPREGRHPTAFAVFGFFAGWAAPLFLFLAGVALPLAGEARMARGLSRSEASWALQKRGWQVFLLAHLFRFQSFLLNPSGQWDGLLKPDILNILGLGIVAASFCWGRVQTPRASARWLLGPMLLVLLLTPLAAHWSWPSLLHPRFEAYIRPVGNNGVFTLFPTVGLVFAGAFTGVVIAIGRDRDRAFLYRSAAGGSAVVMAALAFGLMPMPGVVAPWATTFSAFMVHVGAIVAALALCALTIRTPSTWHPLMVFGRTSLFVYWVHVELAYGIFSFPLHYALPLPWAVSGYLAMLVLMYLAALVLLRHPIRAPLVPAHMRGA